METEESHITRNKKNTPIYHDKLQQFKQNT